MQWNAQQQRIHYWAGVGFFSLVLLSLLLGSFHCYQRLSDRQLQPMTQLLIAGDRQYVQDHELQAALANTPLSGNFFSLDVNSVTEKLEALPWIKQVSVRKQWPDKLRINLQEQKVAALWNEQGLLNQQGDIFHADPQSVSESLVALEGPDDKSLQVLRAFQELQLSFSAQNISLKQVSLSERHAWHLVLSNGIKVELGREDRNNRIQRLLAVYPQLDTAKIAYVDLRYDTGLAIGWKEQQGLAVNDQSNG